MLISEIPEHDKVKSEQLKLSKFGLEFTMEELNDLTYYKYV